MDSKLIRKIHMDCPICDKTHEVEERTRLAVVTVKGDKVEYEQRYLFCGNAGEEDGVFETGEMNNENLHRARNAYRVKHGLLTSDDIVGIREGYGLSQVDLARILGWGEATISRYESKAIQDESYDYLLRLINDNPLVVLEFYNKNKSKIAESKQMDVYARIVKRLEAHGKEYLTRQAIEGEYVKSNSNSVGILYTYLCKDPSLYSPSFIDAFAYRLACDMCYDLTNISAKQSELLSVYESHFLPIAKSKNAKEQAPDEVKDGYWVDAIRG